MLTAVPALTIAGEAITDTVNVLGETAQIQPVDAEKYSHAQSLSPVQPEVPKSTVDCEALETLVKEGEGKLQNYQKTGKQLEEQLQKE